MDIKRQPKQVASDNATQHPSFGPPRRPIAFLVLTIAFIFILFGSVLAAAFYMKANTGSVVTPDTSKYQAVFMTNGQVYFGKLTNVSSKYQTLTNVYYLQVQQAVQPADKDESNSSQISLTKLGKELHGPTDRMNISTDQVLFWEDLNDDSAIVKAIKTYQSKQ